MTGETCYTDLARRAQQYLLEQMFDPERGFAHYHDGAPHLYGLLLDNAAALVGLARTYAALSEQDYLVAAVPTADLILRALGEGTDFASQADCPSGDLAFEDGVLAAEGLLSLGRLTGAARYCQAARRIVEALADGLAGQRVGTLARFGSLVEGPLEIDAGAPGTGGAPGPARQEWGSAR